MKKYLSVIQKSPLFSGIAASELEPMLLCLSPVIKEYEKNAFILRFGEDVSSIGVVLSGSAHIIKEDFWGNRNIVTEVSIGQLFAETFACVQGEVLAVDVVAAEPTIVIFLDVRRIMSTCSSACEFHSRLIRNLLSVVAQKNLMLNSKLSHMAQRSTREKLLSYLSAESQKQGSPSFEIPFNRQQLADYLSVDRSAMSNELCKLRDEGTLKFEKRSFKLL
ncbi:MAG: Crp/Fnr family transcriptional regulator [Oscillospiraceae bacterium]|nr:Crp/Fnr family transcriptional regulator [Oscillospiraceae bacterium]